MPSPPPEILAEKGARCFFLAMERDFLCAIGRKEKGTDAVKEETRPEPGPCFRN